MYLPWEYKIKVIMFKKRYNNMRIDTKEKAKRKGEEVFFMKEGGNMPLPEGCNAFVMGKKDALLVYSPKRGEYAPMTIEEGNLIVIDGDVRLYQRSKDVEDLLKYKEEIPALLRFAPFIIIVACCIAVGFMSYTSYMGISQTQAGILPVLERYVLAMEKLIPILERLGGSAP